MWAKSHDAQAQSKSSLARSAHVAGHTAAQDRCRGVYSARDRQINKCRKNVSGTGHHALQSPGTGPFFGSIALDLRGIVGRKHGPVPFAFLVPLGDSCRDLPEISFFAGLMVIFYHERDARFRQRAGVALQQQEKTRGKHGVTVLKVECVSKMDGRQESCTKSVESATLGQGWPSVRFQGGNHRHTYPGELQSLGTGPFFGSITLGLRGIVGRKHGPVPFAFEHCASIAAQCPDWGR